MLKCQKIFKLNKIILVLMIIFFTAAPIQAQTEKEIEFWTINLKNSYQNYFLNKISQYEADNPEIKIIWEDISFSSINQQLRYRIAEGNVPEVVNLSPQLMASLLKAELLFPISSLDKNYSSSYYPLLWENGSYQEQYYAFPWYLSSKLMVFNQEIFKIAGHNPAEIPETKTELFNLAEKITEKTGVYGLMPQIKIQHEFLEAGIDLFKVEAGQTKAAFNNQKAVEIIKNYQKLAAEGVIPADSLSAGFNIALERYQNNDLAILFTAPQFLSQIESESVYLNDVTALAAVPTAAEGVINAALMNLVIPKGADHKSEAADFAHFITSAEAQQEFSQLASVLPSAVIEESAEFETEEIILRKKAEESLSSSAQKILRKQLPRYQDLTLVHPRADQLIKIMEEQFAKAFAGKITAEAALNIMEEKWNQILAEVD